MDVNTETPLVEGVLESEALVVEPAEDKPAAVELLSDENAAIAENTVTTPKQGILARLRRGLCLALCAVGAASYIYLGYCGVRYLKNGGFAQLVGSQIFGGTVSAVMPLPVPETEAPMEIPEDSANVEYALPVTADLSALDPATLFNETGYDPDADSVPASAVIPDSDEGGAVLIIHTHGTEGYASTEGIAPDEDFRTADPGESIVAVGSAFAEILRERGIETIHCREMFDAESYIEAYDRSAAAVAEYMKDYPQIGYVIDIHRDAVIREDGTVVRSDGGSGAQLMIVCGTDEMGADFPDWRENFAFGKEYQRRLFEKSPGLVRHMNLRGASFNQQLCPRYLLLEVGTCGNTLAEALASTEIAAEVFADLIGGAG